MYKVVKFSDDGFPEVLASFDDEDDAFDYADEMCEKYPYAFIDVV